MEGFNYNPESHEPSAHGDSLAEERLERARQADEEIRLDKLELEKDWTGRKRMYQKVWREMAREAAFTGTRSSADLARGTREWFYYWQANQHLPEEEAQRVSEEVGGLWMRAFGRGSAVEKYEAAKSLQAIYGEDPGSFYQFLRAVLPVNDRPHATFPDELEAVIRHGEGRA